MSMLPVHIATIRLFIHILAATIWVGGQLTLAALVHDAKILNREAPKKLARRFNSLAWPAYIVLIITGVWNIIDARALENNDKYVMTLMIKLTVVALSGMAAFLHSIAKSKKGLAIWGAIVVSTALGALFLGVLLRT